MRFYKLLNAFAHKALNSIQHVVGSPLWVVANTLFFVGWMASQLFLQHPLDPPNMFFPGTVWAMTVIGYIIELAMKAQNQLIFEVQQKQAELQQEQMNRIEFLSRASAEQGKRIEKMLADNAQKDAIIRHLVSQWHEFAKTLTEKN